MTSRHTGPRLSPDLRADEGLRLVLRALFEAMLAHEPGVRAGAEDESLHDFRVAVRRTRSLLGQVRRVFPAAAVEGPRAAFGWLGSATGAARDLQVLLAAWPPRKEVDAATLAPVRRLLEADRSRAQTDLAAALDSPRYARLVDDWRAFLDAAPGGPDDDAPLAARPLGAVLSACMARRHRKLLRRGRALGGDPLPGDLHALRIDAKKLRYLVDAARPLHPARETARPRALLRRLQDVLGDHQDTVVQAQLLTSAGVRLAEAGPVDALVLLELGRAIEVVARRGRDLRRRFAKRWEAFDTPEAHRAFDALLARHGDAVD